MATKKMKLSIDQKNLQEILDSKESGESIAFAGEVRDGTLYLEETYSRGGVFWSLSKCLAGKSTGYTKYDSSGIILHGVHDKKHYEIYLSNDDLKTLSDANSDS